MGYFMIYTNPSEAPIIRYVDIAQWRERGHFWVFTIELGTHIRCTAYDLAVTYQITPVVNERLSPTSGSHESDQGGILIWGGWTSASATKPVSGLVTRLVCIGLPTGALMEYLCKEGDIRSGPESDPGGSTFQNDAEILLLCRGSLPHGAELLRVNLLASVVVGSTESSLEAASSVVGMMIIRFWVDQAVLFPSTNGSYVYDEWIHPLLNIPVYSHDYQLNKDLSIQSTYPTHTQHIDEAAGTIHPENLTTNTHGDKVVVRRTDSQDWTGSPWNPLKSTLAGPEAFGLALIMLNEVPRHTDPVDMDTTHNRRQEGMSVGTSSGQNSHTSINPTACSLGPATLSGISHTPAVTQSQERKGPRARLKKSQETGKGPTAGSSRMSRRADLGGSPNLKGPFSCNVQGCSKKYKQSQGLGLHYREKHTPNLCAYCGNLEWARPYRYRKHLEKWHPGLNFEVALDRATGPFTPSTPEHDQWGHAGSQPYPLTSSPPHRVTKVSAIFPQAVSPVDHNLQPESEVVEPTTWAKHEHEDSPQSEVLGIRTAFSFTEEYTEPEKDLEMSGVCLKCTNLVVELVEAGPCHQENLDLIETS
ncbi:hypothetical protein BJV74DRAFT_990666 [Russula compacta]|nr:hypothetical protein BJV74DRAFT_990666 [Russula compacta]